MRKATKKTKKSSTHRKKATNASRHQGVRSLDQVQESIRKGSKIEEIDDYPAGGKFSCVPCDLYFHDEKTLEVHLKTKGHKRRLKEIKGKSHTVEDAERAAGLY